MAESPQPYTVSYTGLVRNEIRRLIATAEPEQARKIIAAVKEFDRLLHLYPQFGEPLQDLQEPGQIRIGAVGPIMMRYAVHDESRAVAR